MRRWASHFNGRRHFDRRPVVTRVGYRFIGQSALEPYLMPANDIFLERLMSDRGPQYSSAFPKALTFKVEFGLKSNGMECCICLLQSGAPCQGLRRTGKGLEDD